jgi:ATP-dependent DNA helicase PIF1
MELSPEQQLAFNKYVEGHNIFITGPGGTGKSVLIKKIQQHAQEEQGKSVAVCALTGCAAILLDCGARTVHSWAGIGIANATNGEIINRVMKSPFKKRAWYETDILIVDEVSMMSQKMFELLDALGRNIRRAQSYKPFGGIQVIFSGDFYQLPPVGDPDMPETTNFCFESPEWYNVFARQSHIQLVKIFRQSDPVYSSILNQLREGKVKRSSVNILNEQVNKAVPEEVIIKPTKLFPTKNKVQQININEMSNLTTPIIEYKMKYVNDISSNPNDVAKNSITVKRLKTEDKLKVAGFTQEQIFTELEQIKKNLICEDLLQLREGAQVMCVVNLDIEFAKICNGSQGIIVGFTEVKDIKVPIVRFTNGVKMAINYHVWPSDNIPGIGVAQIPLILSWALTIHKSQGATLDIAEIDAGSGIFECGQTYVALSRVKSLEGLYLTALNVGKIKVNKKVQEFYNTLSSTITASSTITNNSESVSDASSTSISDASSTSISDASADAREIKTTTILYPNSVLSGNMATDIKEEKYDYTVKKIILG